MADNPPPPCGKLAPIHSGDEGPNHCSRPKGHEGGHWCMPHETPWQFKGLPGWGRSWTDDDT